ncbi:hypothetical protein EC973_002205 [Apophysomyces ossiformis]|uniref:Uncharacterized protein n=1 Tax=Apophysomyces ossiformis TaxID=679940 RepID=A0A8H7BXW5_9FUNG|nr:hypothetical protein EC973_002205 [Apophysomyces ossiformis]
MPATRSTAAANSKVMSKPGTGSESSSSHSGHSNTSETNDQRENLINPYNELLLRFFHILLNADKEKLLEAASQKTHSISEIEKKLQNDEYANIKEFKHDLDRLFGDVLSNLGPDRAKHETLQRLYHFASTSLRLENDRLQKKTSHTIEQDVWNNNSISQKTALFRPTSDGFVFSDSTYYRSDKEKLPANIAEVTIHPTTPEAYDIPPLKQTVAPPTRFPNKFFRHEDKHVIPIQWLDYGAFSSFAPACDSNNANVSYESTYMGRAAKRFRRWEKKQRNLQGLSKIASSKATESEKSPEKSKADANDTIDVTWLQSQGLDPDAIAEAAQQEVFQVDDLLDNNDIDCVLERNNKLLEQLVQCQEYRFSLNDQRWGKIDQKERDIAETLQDRISMLASTLPPKSLISTDEIPTAMSQLPLLETAYQGSLPPTKIFAFPTTDKADPMPPYANITPTYAKERWRLVDVGTTSRVSMEK